MNCQEDYVKKYGLVIVLSIVLIGSAIVNYGQYNKVNDVQIENASLTESLAERDSENKTLMSDLASKNKEAKQLNSSLQEAEQELIEKDETLQLIDTKLKAGGKIIEKIEALQKDNEQWREELNKMSLKVKALEAKTTTEAEDAVIETPPSDDTWKQTVSDIQDIVVFIENRIGELEEAASSLPTISLERLMVQQEINFLTTAQSDLELVADQVTEANK